MSVQLPPPGLLEEVEAKLEPREEAIRELVPQLLAAILQELQAIRASQGATPPANVLPDIPPTPPYQALPTAAQSGGLIDRAVASPYAKAPDFSVAISTFPIEVYRGSDLTVAANTGLMTPAVFQVPANGEVLINVALSASGASAVPQVTLNGGNDWAKLNQGAQLIPGAVYSFSVIVFRGDRFDLSFDAATVVQSLRAVYVPTL